jgi:hypothetical protein
MLMLIHLSVYVYSSNWVMRNMSSISFSILIDGDASKSLRSSRSLIWGHHLLEILFLVVDTGAIEILFLVVDTGAIGS